MSTEALSLPSVTRIAKDIRGAWSATTTVNMTQSYALRIRTFKNYNGDLVTLAETPKVEKGHLIHQSDKDFSRRLATVRPQRVSATVVDNLHWEQLEKMEEVLAAVKAHYLSHHSIIVEPAA